MKHFGYSFLCRVRCHSVERTIYPYELRALICINKYTCAPLQRQCFVIVQVNALRTPTEMNASRTVACIRIGNTFSFRYTHADDLVSSVYWCARPPYSHTLMTFGCTYIIQRFDSMRSCWGYNSPCVFFVRANVMIFVHFVFLFTTFFWWFFPSHCIRSLCP